MEIYHALSILILFCCLFELSNDLKIKYGILLVLCIISTLFGGLRWNTGNDWEQYYWHFESSQWNNIFNYIRYSSSASSINLEPGFVFINVLIKSIFGSFYWYNIIICGFLQFTYFRFIKDHCHNHPLLLYAAIQLLAFLYFPVRSGLAVGVCLWGYKYVKERKLVPFLIIVLIASSIHLQCLVFLPVYWLGKISLNKFIYISIYIIIFILGSAFQNYFQTLALYFGGSVGEKLSIYSEFETEGVIKLSYSSFFLKLFLFWIYLSLPHGKIFKSESWYYSLINIFLLSQCIDFIFKEGMGELARLKDPFYVVSPYLFVYSLIYYIKTNKGILRLGSLIFFVIYMVRQIVNLGSGYYFKITCIPYRTIFDYGYHLFYF